MGTGKCAVKGNGFSVGDCVVYAGNGICRINDIRTEKFSDMEERLYYVMNSVYDDKAKFYLPVHMDGSCEKLRPLLSRDEILSVIDKSEDIGAQWIENDESRTAVFEDVLKSRDISKILWLIKILHVHKAEMRESGKKFRACDEKILAAAERGVKEEFAFVLGLRRDGVIPYIVNYLTGRRDAEDDERRRAGADRANTVHYTIERAKQQGKNRPLQEGAL